MAYAQSHLDALQEALASGTFDGHIRRTQYDLPFRPGAAMPCETLPALSLGWPSR